MSLSDPPSPLPEGGWSSPGLTAPDDFGKGLTVPRSLTRPNMYGRQSSWDAARAKSAKVNSYPSFATQRLSWWESLRNVVAKPRGRRDNQPYADKEKLGRGRWQTRNTRSPSYPGSSHWRWLLRRRSVILSALLLVLCAAAFFGPALQRSYERLTYGRQGEKFVLVIATNVGGGVMEWKGAREWAIERDSIRNKKAYARRWGYDVEVVDMSTKKKYAHEWRESWEKVDVLRACMTKYPQAEWFWWLDLNTFIMEPSYSLQHHLFEHLDTKVYRDINIYNPLNISHPPTDIYLDDVSKSPVGDNKTESISLLVPQDCGGFNLGSFFVRRSVFTDRLLDHWWDPVSYDQKHMEWEHKEQDALEWIYRHQPWVRTGTAFLPLRVANSFPPGACGTNSTDLHYNVKDRDFVVNMAGCEFGRDCWGEMFYYRELSTQLNRPMLLRFKHWLAATTRRA